MWNIYTMNKRKYCRFVCSRNLRLTIEAPDDTALHLSQGAGWSNVNSQRHGCELQSKACGSDILWNEWSCHAHSIREHGISGKQSWGVGYPQLSSSGGDMPALRTFVVEGDIPHASHSRVEGICLPHFGRWHASQVTTTALLGPVKLYKLRMVLSWELTN